MLKIENLNVFYGGIHALKGITIDIPESKIVTLLGANGAGKSTALRAITGLVKSSSGSIHYSGANITNRKTVAIARSGITLVPEGRRIFANLTVLENLILGAYQRNDQNEIKQDLEKIFAMFPRVQERVKQVAGTLSGGEQQMVAIGRALMSRPKLLLMDEPSLGLAPLIVKDVFRIIKSINEQGITILLIEQNAAAALQIADYGYVLETGKIVMAGPGKELATNDDVRKAYLGNVRC